MLIKRTESNRRAITKDIIAYYIATFHNKLRSFCQTFIAHDGDKFTLPFSLLLRPTNKGEHGFYPVNSQTESITRVITTKRNYSFLVSNSLIK